MGMWRITIYPVRSEKMLSTILDTDPAPLGHDPPSVRLVVGCPACELWGIVLFRITSEASKRRA